MNLKDRILNLRYNLKAYGCPWKANDLFVALEKQLQKYSKEELIKLKTDAARQNVSSSKSNEKKSINWEKGDLLGHGGIKSNI